MTDAQFIHIETYALTKGRSKRSFREIAREATRAPDACPHVAAPKEPLMLYPRPSGTESPALSLDELVAFCEHVSETGRDMLGRRIRKDAQLILAGVASFPVESDAVFSNSEIEKRYLEWVEQTLQFLRDEYSDNLRLVIQHVDERFPHLHFYVVGNVRDGMYTIDGVHPGRAAQADIPIQRGVKGNGAARRAAYKAAMEQLQDRYHEAIGGLNLARSTVRRRRVSRRQWHAGMHLTKTRKSPLRKYPADIGEKPNTGQRHR